MGALKAKIPAAVATGVICLLIGGGAGAVIMFYAAEEKPERQAMATKGDNEYPDRSGGGAKGKTKGEKGDKGAPGAGGAPVRQPPPLAKVQLSQLVSKLEVLTRKPLAVELTPDQKKQVRELLAGLEGADELSEADAKAKLDGILKLVETHRETLEAAGYRWPGAPGGGGMQGGPAANPFKSGDAADRLKSLRATLEK